MNVMSYSLHLPTDLCQGLGLPPSFALAVLDSPWRTSSGRQSDLNTGNCIHCSFREVMALVSGGPPVSGPEHANPEIEQLSRSG